MTCYVYHIHTTGMGLDEGYIGISTEPITRWSKHKSRNSDSNPVLKRAIKKYKPNFTIIASFDTLEEALWQEFTLRPFECIGWNLNSGGGMPPKRGGWNKGVKTPQETKNKLSKARVGRFTGHSHPRSRPVNIYDADTHKLVANNVVVRTWAKKNGYHQAHLTATATGKLQKHKGIYARYVTDSRRPQETSDS